MVTSGWGPGANSSIWTDAVVVKNHHGGMRGQTAVLEVKGTQDEPGGAGVPGEERGRKDCETTDLTPL